MINTGFMVDILILYLGVIGADENECRYVIPVRVF